MTYRDDDVAASLRVEGLLEELAAEESVLADVDGRAARLEARVAFAQATARRGHGGPQIAAAIIGVALGVTVAARHGVLDDALVRVPGLRGGLGLGATVAPADDALQFTTESGAICQLTFVESATSDCITTFACDGGLLDDGTRKGSCIERGGIVQVDDGNLRFAYVRRLGRAVAVVDGMARPLMRR